MHRTIVSIFVSMTLLITSNYLAFSQTPSSEKELKRIAKIKKDLAKIGLGNTITVSRLDKRDFFGRVKNIGSDDFEIVETDSGQALSFKYSDLKNVRKGDGERNLITGKRKNPQRGWLYGAILFGVLFTVLGIALSDKDF